MDFPLVSVVITTKNEEKNIENCLKSILQQNYLYDKIEIIVVDNDSGDKTKEIAKRHTDKVFNKGPERSAQRNFGANKAQGKYYLYLDADMILSKNVVEECVDKLERDKDIIALYIPEIIIGDGFWPKVRCFERSFYNATVIDCVRFIRIKDFLIVQGFDESMSGPEDWDFDKKIRNRGKVDIAKSVIYHNEGEFNLRNYLKKKAYYIQSFDKYIAKWGKNDRDIKKQLGFYYRFFGIFIEDGKWKKLLARPILTLGMLALRFMVGVNYLLNKNKNL
ncbi:glycosyltransferase [Candidatus Parcubacteria bacterium]|nr:glycosyltransferase [Candidatus Parcubacteria bacterium]